MQFKLFVASNRARDTWVVCVHRKGYIWAYMDAFRHNLLHINDTAPEDVLDRLVRGLSATIRI